MPNTYAAARPGSRRGRGPWPTAFMAGSVALVVVACGARSQPSIGGAGVSSSTASTGSSSSGAGTGGGAAAPGACAVPADCAWGEIDHEILLATDCPCLFGCASLPLSKITVARRRAQYNALCDPTHDGHGNPCGVDDCAGGGPFACSNGACRAGP